MDCNLFNIARAEGSFWLALYSSHRAGIPSGGFELTFCIIFSVPAVERLLRRRHVQLYLFSVSRCGSGGDAVGGLEPALPLRGALSTAALLQQGHSRLQMPHTDTARAS